jgi:hypothetical protein
MATQTREAQSTRGAGVILYPTDLVIRTANLRVAAVDASAAEIRTADYLCGAADAHTVIAAAVTALPAGGGKISLSTGGFVFGAAYALNKDNVTIEGQGLSTLLTFDAGTPIITTTGRTGIVIQNLATDAGGLGTAATQSVFDYWQAGVWMGGIAINEAVVLQVWVTLGAPTPSLGAIPPNAQVMTVDVWVQEAFNAGTTNLLTIGFTADPDYYMEDLDVAATGVKTPIATAIIKTVDATGRAAVAYFSQTGGAATTGKALVTLTYVNALEVPA